jgi:hypothetical protein
MRECVNTFYVSHYLLTPWSRALFEKLTVNFAASQEIPRIYRTRKSLTVPTSARHLSLSWANSIQSPRPSPTFWRSILLLSSHLRLGFPHTMHILTCTILAKNAVSKRQNTTREQYQTTTCFDTPVPKHAGFWYWSWVVFYVMYFTVFYWVLVCWYLEYKNMHLFWVVDNIFQYEIKINLSERLFVC